MSLMSNPYVTSVTLRNNQVVLTIDAHEFTPGDSLEIAGHATQTGGAFAVFNAIQTVPKLNPDGKAYMWVTASPSADFKNDHAITVVLRAARVWTTVVDPQPGPGSSAGAGAVYLPPDGDGPADEDPTWNVVRTVAYAVPSPTENPGQAPTASGASFPDTT
jgi:hypothetical protein